MRDLFPDAPIPLAAQIREVEREIAQRSRVYPRQVKNGRMTQAAADRQMTVLAAVLKTLRGLEGG